jgi:hypothetical protein
MIITVTKNNVAFSSLMKISFVGYFIGMGLVVTPFVLLDIGGMNGGANGLTAAIVMLIILGVQAILLGLILDFGLFVYSRFKRIEVEVSEKKKAFDGSSPVRACPCIRVAS